MHEADKLNIRNCQLGILPLGTGNDLARVFGWGAAYGSRDLRSLSNYIDHVEKAKVSLLDRCVWFPETFLSVGKWKFRALCFPLYCPHRRTLSFLSLFHPFSSIKRWSVRIQPLPSGLLAAGGSFAESEAEDVTTDEEGGACEPRESDVRSGASAAVPASTRSGSVVDSRRDTQTSSESPSPSRRASDKLGPSSLARTPTRGSRLFRRLSSASRSSRRQSDISSAAVAVRKAYTDALSSGRYVMVLRERRTRLD